MTDKIRKLLLAGVLAGCLCTLAAGCGGGDATQESVGVGKATREARNSTAPAANNATTPK